MERTIFGHTIWLKSIGCNVVGRAGQPISPSVNLFPDFVIVSPKNLRQRV